MFLCLKNSITDTAYTLSIETHCENGKAGLSERIMRVGMRDCSIIVENPEKGIGICMWGKKQGLLVK